MDRIAKYKGKLVDEISEQIKISLFRVTQEALINIIEHAEAQEAQVSLKKVDQNIQLIISDNGKGLNIDQIDTHNGLGILGMRERMEMIDGSLEIRTSFSEGTTIIATCPNLPG